MMGKKSGDLLPTNSQVSTRIRSIKSVPQNTKGLLTLVLLNIELSLRDFYVKVSQRLLNSQYSEVLLRDC